jgi:hypothetical protein
MSLSFKRVKKGKRDRKPGSLKPRKAQIEDSDNLGLKRTSEPRKETRGNRETRSFIACMIS